MHRNTPESQRNPRHTAERDASQAMGGQPRTDDEEDDLQEPEQVPSFLTARELQARVPGKGPAPETGSGLTPRKIRRDDDDADER